MPPHFPRSGKITLADDILAECRYCSTRRTSICHLQGYQCNDNSQVSRSIFGRQPPSLPLPFPLSRSCLPFHSVPFLNFLSSPCVMNPQCLDVWIVGHQSCPYCKADLNVLPPESDPGPDISSAAAYTCSLLSNVSLLLTWPLDLLRECRERRQQWRQQRRQQQQQVDDSSGNVDLASTMSSPAAASLAMPRMVDGGIVAVP